MTIDIVVVATVTVRPPRPCSEILVPVDPDSTDHRAVLVARTLALATGAHVTLVAVAEPDVPVPDGWRDSLHHLASVVGPASVSAVVARCDTVADGVIEAADDLSRAIVCMTTDAPGRFRDAFDLTSSSAVVHHVHRPVVLLGPAAVAFADRPRDVVAFVDPSDLADDVVRTGADWAEAMGARLWVVEVIEPDLTVGGGSFDSNYVARLAGKHHRDGLDIEFEVLRARDPGKEIARFLADDHPDALAVLGSHGRSGWAELRLGSVCMRAAHDSPGPVLVVPALRR